MNILGQTLGAAVVAMSVGMWPVAAHADEGVVTPADWRALASDSDIELRIATQQYAVKGSTPSQINGSLAVAGPRAINHKEAVGAHGGRFGVRYLMMQGPSGCDLYSHDVVYNAKTVLPHWTSPASASTSTVQWWNRYLHEIEQHEQEHAFIAVLELYALDQVLDSLAPRSSCDDIEADVRAALNERSRSASRSNRDFDKWTKNGRLGPYWLG